MKRWRPLLLCVTVLAGCDVQDQAMRQQKKYGTYAAAGLWDDQTEARPLPAHTRSIPAGTKGPMPPDTTPALLTRGRQRYEIYCSPCHGFDGSGNGVIVARGFPRPPSYHSERLRQIPAQHIFDVITNGYGVMYPYRDRVSESDRWAIIAYIRALQLARLASVQDPAHGEQTP